VATTQLWTEQDKETKTQYKVFFGQTTDLTEYDDLQLELLHSYRLHSLLVKKRKADLALEESQRKRALPTPSSSDESTTRLDELTKKCKELEAQNATLRDEKEALEEKLKTQPTLSTAQADSIVAFIKERACSTDATEELTAMKATLAAEKRHHTAVWDVLKANCADDPRRFQEFKDRLDHELGRTKIAPPVNLPRSPAPKRIAYPREHDDVHFKDGDKKRKGTILRVLQNRCYRVAPNDGGAGGPQTVSINELFDAHGEQF
jgi:cell division protein FtsB